MYTHLPSAPYVRETVPSFLKEEDALARLTEHGAHTLHNAALLSLLLSLPLDRTAHLYESMGDSLFGLSFSELRQHLTARQSARIMAAIELSQRALKKGLGTMPIVSSPADVLPLLIDIRTQRKEHFLCLYLNARNQVIHKEVVSIGSLSASIVHPREVFSIALTHAAASVVLAHNHPSGDVTPSQEDVVLTRRLVQAGQLMVIDVLDHIIIGQADYLSLKEQGLM